MEAQGLQWVLPAGMLDHFDVEQISEGFGEKTKWPFVKVVLVEKNQLPAGYDRQDYESKGFYEPVTVEDFPLRGKQLFLQIKRRRWRHKVHKEQEIKADYSFLAEGVRMTADLAAFLKGKGGLKG
jgi:hypothetical protein